MSETLFLIVIIIFIGLQIATVILESSYRRSERALRLRECRAERYLADELRRFNNNLEEVRKDVF